MSLAGWVIGAVLLSAPLEWTQGQARFTFELGGLAVGTVEFEGRCYRSTHLFARGRPTVRTSCEEGPLPGVSWSLLLRRTSPGCQPVREELTGREGRLCVDARQPRRDRGTAFDQRFDARYGADGTLVELTLGASRFVRTTTTPGAPGATPLAEGVAAPEGQGVLALEPSRAPLTLTPLSPSRWTLAQVAERGRALAARSGDGECLAIARALTQEVGADAAEVVYGLAVEGERAFPHAWVRVHTHDAGMVQLDPALGVEVTASTHLPLATPRAPGGAGAAYVALMEGRLRLVRRPAR